MIPNGGYSRSARHTRFDTFVAIKTKAVYVYTENETIYTKKHQNNKYTKMRLKLWFPRIISILVGKDLLASGRQ